MPGLVGIITKTPRQQAEAELLRMVASLLHESSYVSGTWIDESLGLYVGWVERRGSFAELMPLQSESGKLVLTFSGEDLSTHSNVQREGQRGPALGANDLSYLVRLAEQDPEFPKSLNGRFHAVLADRERKRVTVFNDRFGMHRLYYHAGKDAFYFAAEAKAILAVRSELRSIDPDGLAEFISCGCTLENRTLFSGIGMLPPASSWTFQQASIARKGFYFEAKEWEEQSPLEPEPYFHELKNVFSRTLPKYLGGRERVGISVTGGLDSRMIMSWADAAPGSLPCYSFGGMYRDSKDVEIGKRVAQACGQPHGVIPVGEEFLAQFPYYAERTVFLTDGCVEVKHAPDLYANERAAKIARLIDRELWRGSPSARTGVQADRSDAKAVFSRTRKGNRARKRNL